MSSLNFKCKGTRVCTFLVTYSKSRQEFDIEAIAILKSMYANNASFWGVGFSMLYLTRVVYGSIYKKYACIFFSGS